MKKYREFIFENTQVVENNEIENKCNEFSKIIRKFIIDNVITERGISFSKDNDSQLYVKRTSKSKKFEEYYNTIDDIFRHRFEEKTPEVLQELLDKGEFKFYDDTIQNILNEKKKSNVQPKSVNVQSKGVKNVNTTTKPPTTVPVADQTQSASVQQNNIP